MTYKINEAEVTRADVKAIFRDAAALRDQPQSRLQRLLKRSKKSSVDINDLQQAWKEEGYPDDLADINAILADHGFDKKEINKVFGQVFGKEDDDNDDEYQAPTGSQNIIRLVAYAKKAGIVDELKAFLQKEYGFAESKKFAGKVMIEDVKKIFTAIVQEERTARVELIRQQEQTQLGRIKK